MTTFKELQLIEPIQKALEAQGYETPTPIQQQAIPHVLQGKDLFGCAQTGTGKTAAFAIPILQQLALRETEKGKRKISTLILTPTRELATQIEENFQEYGKNLDLRTAVIFGGVNQNNQVKRLQNGVDILVATPGRLLDLISQKYISLAHIEIFVLDEADRMLDMGFIHDVKKLLTIIPKKRQTLFFSATMPDSILSLANSILTNPVKVEVTPASTTAETIKQSVYFIDKDNKNLLLLDNLRKDIDDSVLVFTRTKHGADKIVKFLEKNNVKSAAIHGNKSQNARQRALDNFKTKEIKVLVATDIAARGIDIDNLLYVINYDLPNIPETYVHRIGRSGRAGAKGIAISYCNYEEKAYLKDIQKITGIQVPVIENHPYPMEVFVVEKKEQKARPPRSQQASNKPKEKVSQKPKSSERSNKPKRNRI
ncbi:DEAD/DEAH box helicase [Paenimyroides tangerinum]|uniref:DEAD-box ATP-dependent RNA helicase RhpA n=1 Tax=Paenimyroides tangerinum TaxID=2488728 RepID=A0A3P3WA52_9FLAO|nr:DEAD/DEAH box helicase [Paenimyroides tangerinum]RRJ92032.1 DEAD/DEAH box helicase [Paenimyroides tangerinum]